MNRKARHAATRSLGLFGIATLFTGFVGAFGQSAPPKQPYSTWSDFGGSVDAYAGENGSWESKYEDVEFLPAGGTGRYTGGPQAGLQAEITAVINGAWGHFKINQPIAPPQLSADDLVSKLKDAISRKAVPLLDVDVYQDGTISPQTLSLFQTARKVIGTASAQP